MAGNGGFNWAKATFVVVGAIESLRLLGTIIAFSQRATGEHLSESDRRVSLSPSRRLEGILRRQS